MNDILAADTAMGPVTLRVGNLDAMTAYYRDGVALQVLEAVGPRVTLGRGTTPVVILEHAPELVHASPRDAGLFHTAILFDTEEALAAAVYSVARKYPNTFTGSSDHLVSKAFYFSDPEGNGVELYWDRERSAWSWAHGAIEMSTLYLDPNAFLQENLTEAAARAQLTALGLVPDVSYQAVPTGDAKDGKVISQNIASGTDVAAGSTVKLKVGKAPPTTTTSSSTTTTSTTTTTTTPPPTT